MSNTMMNGILFRNMCKGGLDAILAEEKKINGLNVFPVPDGDTGTNMKLTLEHGVKDSYDVLSLGEFTKALSRGMLLGARGNSGVILSQIFKGIYRYLKDMDSADAKEFANALVSGYKNAYDAVIHPVEGTILTVARLGIENIMDTITCDTTIEDLIDLYITSMKEVLRETPNMLPVLKEAGVIDSGGAGLIVIFEGMQSVLLGKEIPHTLVEEKKEVKEEILFDADSILEFGYCTEFILQLQNAKCNPDTFDLNTFIAFLETKGDSIVALKDESIVKVHIHTMTPGDVMNEAQKYGEFVTFKLENMSIQHNEVLEEKKNKLPHRRVSIIAVGQGEGIIELYENFGAQVVLDGGKTMNTSTEEFLEAFKMIDAEDIIILPNNKNIHLAATQAANMKDSKHIHVLPTKSLVEGYFAFSMSNTTDDISAEEQLQNMTTGLENIHTFGVTMAVKDSSYNGISIHRGDYISVLDGDIIYTSKDKKDAVLNGLALVPSVEDKEAFVLFRGKNLAEDEADEIIELLEENYSNAQCGIIEGGQDTYGVLIGIS